MSSEPRRPSPAVYRRRRLAAVLIGILLIAGAWWLVSALTSWLSQDDSEQDNSEATGSARPAETSPADPEGENGGGNPGEEDDPTTDPEETDSEDTSGGEDSASDEEEGEDQGADSGEESEGEEPSDSNCAPSDITVTAATGRDSYAPDEAPLLIMEIEHVGSEECTVDLGTAQQEFSVSHNGREIFTTVQCDTGEEHPDIEHFAVEMGPGQVERAQLTWPRSDSAADCSEPTQLEPGQYDLVVSLGGITSDPAEFRLQE